MNRLVLTTGGTGGHIFPALAVAEAAYQRWPGLRVLFIGGRTGPEERLARQAGLDFVGLPVAGVLGRGLKSVAAAWSLARGVWAARKLLRGFAPQAVLGCGGYAGFSPVYAAVGLGLPTAIHEQNSLPGLANRLLGKRVDAVCVSFEDTGGAFPKAKTVLTGNPVRAEIRALSQRAGSVLAPGKRVLVVGGSQGAQAVNSAVLAALPQWREAGVELTHQTGPADLERVRSAYASADVEARVEAFIDDMAGAYAGADLVVARAGATTIAELACASKPSLLVPFPHATHDHQTVNARFLADAGAAVLLPQDRASELGWQVLSLLADPRRLASMALAARGLGRPDAARAVVDVLARIAAPEGRP